MASLLSKIVERTGKPPSPNSKIANIVWRRGVERSAELDRIRALPRRVLKLDEIPDLTPLYRHTEICGVRGCDLCSRGPARLLPLQSAALFEAEKHRGVLGALRPGGGKTLLSMLLVDALNLHRAVILVPPDVRDQLITVDIPRYARHFTLPIGRFTVVSYSQLSNARTADVLERIDPDGIIADEAHNLRNSTASRTKRFKRCMKERPGIPFVPLSGTLTTRGPKDYGHLSEYALRAGSPVPRGYKELEDWDDALRTRKDSEEPAMPPGALLALCSDEELSQLAAGTITGKEAAGAGFLRRLTQTSGVISSGEGDVDCSLIIRERNRHPALMKLVVPAVVTDALRDLERTWTLGEEEIDSAATMAMKAREISNGFYLIWDWPNGVVDREWIDARKDWNRAVRDVLAHRSKPGLDSPMFVANSAMRGTLGCYEKEWGAWDAVRSRPQPPTKPIWLSDFIGRDAAAWAEWARKSEQRNGIVWFAHTALEGWIAANTDIPTFGAGTSDVVTELSAESTRRHDVVALSINVHRTGKNLQHLWSQNYFACCPASGEPFEQAIARTHRRGQKFDEVTVDIPLHTNAVRGAWESALVSALYMQERSMSGPQRLLYAMRLM